MASRGIVARRILEPGDLTGYHMNRPTTPILVDKKSNGCHAKSTCPLDLGTQVTLEGVQFRLWAPKSAQVDVVLHLDKGTCTLLTLPMAEKADSAKTPELNSGPITQHAAIQRGARIRILFVEDHAIVR